jgi:hypothetical protein
MDLQYNLQTLIKAPFLLAASFYNWLWLSYILCISTLRPDVAHCAFHINWSYLVESLKLDLMVTLTIWLRQFKKTKIKLQSFNSFKHKLQPNIT